MKSAGVPLIDARLWRPTARMFGPIGAVLLLSLDVSGAAAASGTTVAAVPDLRGFSIEDLANVEITSVMKQAESLSDAPAAIYVITNQDIRRSGATSIPEVLRLAPNLQVAQVSNSSYAITARGFNSTAANKLLVLIDGRSVYTPLFSGVFWDLQDVLLEDVERIEVISGPGGTLWGANAVNGVINIITKSSRDTQGGYLAFGGGDTKYGGAARWGGKVGDEATYRLYAKGLEYGPSDLANGTRLHDAWHKPQGGFRTDWARDADALTVQGDLYQGSEEQALNTDTVIAGHNLLSRWNRKLNDGAALQVQAYYDFMHIATPGTLVIDESSTYDLEAQHNFALGEHHEVVWGAGYRYIRDRIGLATTSFFLPPQRNVTQASLFAQDSVSLTSDLKLILGMRLENNTYTGLAPIPSARLAWKVADDALLWSAVSRAVRTPSRLDHDLFQTSGRTTVVAGGRNFRDEKLTAYEVGYRQQLSTRASFSISTFYNVYDELRSFELSAGGRLPIVVGNKMAGHTYGAELWGNYAVTDWWRLSAGFNVLHENLRFTHGSTDIIGLAAAGDDPHHQVSARSSMNITDTVEFDFGLREVARLPHPAVPSYVSVDARVGWRFLDNAELSVSATNLFDNRHQEFGTLPLQFGGAPLTNIGRSVFVSLVGRY